MHQPLYESLIVRARHAFGDDRPDDKWIELMPNFFRLLRIRYWLECSFTRISKPNEKVSLLDYRTREGVCPSAWVAARVTFWFFLATFLFRRLVTGRGDTDTLKPEVLALMGISGATSVGAAFIGKTGGSGRVRHACASAALRAHASRLK